MTQTNPDTAEAKINLLFDSYADGDISADEAKQQLKGLLVDAQREEAIWWHDNHHRAHKVLDDRLAALQQTRQEEVSE